jgi:glycosyltransferase involved in cell wall biosynthesis
MSLSIIFAIQNSGLPYCFFIDDFWLEPSLDRWFSIWDRRAGRNRIKRILKTFLHISGIAPLVDKYIPINKEKLDFQNLLFPNNEFCSLVRQLNIPLKDTFIVGQGVDTSLFSPSPHAQCNNIKLLYVGQLLKAKGVHTAIEAMEILVHKLAITNLSLEVIGEAVDKDYRLFLEKIIKGFQLENYVFFRDKLPREEIARVYREYDILIFPSIWKEPHGNVLMEAMASGMAIVSTATGGNKEFLRDGENCLIFQAGNAQDLAMKIVYLIRNEELRRKISENARKYILEYHRLDSVVDSIEETLMYILRKNRGVILINR